MKTILVVFPIAFFIFFNSIQPTSAQGTYSLNIAGEWAFQIDSDDVGLKEKWFGKKLTSTIFLPGSMTTNQIGNDIDLKTPWTGGILDSSYYKDPEYAKFRVKGNIKIPFWLQPIKYYKGMAWYQKTINVPSSLSGKDLLLILERPHWQTMVWIDGIALGRQNSLGTPHQYLLPSGLSTGSHSITIRVNNDTEQVRVGQDSHSITDNTQGNWNGIVGKLQLVAKPRFRIFDLKVFPDIDKKQVMIKVVVGGAKNKEGRLEFQVVGKADVSKKLALLSRRVKLSKDLDTIIIIYPIGKKMLFWDEFNPNLYQLRTTLESTFGRDINLLDFGMRKFSANKTQLLINNRPLFLRGTLDCAVFPLTGFPPTDVASWKRIFLKARSYGMNHIRFHSWTPPQAAFTAADELGFYLQIECSSWANGDARIGEGNSLDSYIYQESERIVNAYGNHPSFVMMAYGNEPKGKDHVRFLSDFVAYWKKKDARRLYTTGAGWPVTATSDFISSPNPRIQRWGEGLKSIINASSPKANYNWSKIISKWEQPTVSHEIGQWCAYPDLGEIASYKGVLKAKNFEIFSERLRDNGLSKHADSFLLASGKLQLLCYKADIEAALRTPGFGGFQLLGLSDFPGQGTATVGVLNAFWEDKKYVNAEIFSQFCAPVVPLAHFPKFIYRNTDSFAVPISVAQYSSTKLKQASPSWEVTDQIGKSLFKGRFTASDIAVGNSNELGTVIIDLGQFNNAVKLTLKVSLGEKFNSWDFFVYPNRLPDLENSIHVTQVLDKKSLQVLSDGGSVLWSIKKGTLAPEMGGDVAMGFSSIFWNTSYTNGQPPTTLGLLCDPKHPALQDFPTQYHSNWQWWDAMSNAGALRLDRLNSELVPIVRVIDDWYTARPLGLIFECRVGKGKLLVSGIDLLTRVEDRPEAAQLLYSLKKYMSGAKFSPKLQVDVDRLTKLSK